MLLANKEANKLNRIIKYLEHQLWYEKTYGTSTGYLAVYEAISIVRKAKGAL